VGIATGLQGGWSGMPTPAGARHSSRLQNVQTGSRGHPVSHLFGSGIISSGLERPASEVSNSSLYSVLIKNEWDHKYSPPTCFHCVDRTTFCIVVLSRTPKRTGNSACNKYKEKRCGTDLAWPLCCSYCTWRQLLTELVWCGLPCEGLSVCDAATHVL
jgi:hypothetical protein